MTATAQQVAQMVDMLPDDEKSIVFELVKRIVLAWDPDFSKVTPAEAAEIAVADEQIERGETVSHDDINWD